MSSHKTVISPTKPQIISGRRPRFAVRETYFDMGRASSDTVCSAKRWFGCLSGHPTAVSGLATVNTRYGVHGHQVRFVTDPALGDQTRISTFCDGGQCVMGGHNAYTGVRPSPPALARSPTLTPLLFVSSLLLGRHSDLGHSRVSLLGLSSCFQRRSLSAFLS
jgi:hypothetical protein